MERAALWLVIGVIAAIAVGSASERARFLLVPGIAIGVYLVSFVAWLALRHVSAAPAQLIASALSLQPHDLGGQPAGTLMSVIPPAVPVVAFLLWRTARRKHRGLSQ